MSKSEETAKYARFSLPGMDCASEENLVRMALEGLEFVKSLHFELNRRQITIEHSGTPDAILSRLVPLGLGARLLEHTAKVKTRANKNDLSSERRVLKTLLVINAVMFFTELSLGIFAQSTGLIADSLDMLADAFVYGLSLYAVGRAIQVKRKVARLSGYLEMLLATGVIVEVIRRFIYGSEPESILMMGIGVLALIANVACMLLLSKHREGEVHMKASWIFSTNDVIANLGVILAGLLVYLTSSPYPDLVVGLIVGAIVLKGGLKILTMSNV